MKCIPNNMEKYISFSLGNLRFINRVNFFLDSLVKDSDPQSFKITQKTYKDEEKRMLLTKKGIYLYEYMDCFKRFSEEKLPAKEAFNSKLNLYFIYSGRKHLQYNKTWSKGNSRQKENYSTLRTTIHKKIN